VFHLQYKFPWGVSLQDKGAQFILLHRMVLEMFLRLDGRQYTCHCIIHETVQLEWFKVAQVAIPHVSVNRNLGERQAAFWGHRCAAGSNAERFAELGPEQQLPVAAGAHQTRTNTTFGTQ
jgi:hypothetical protein